MVVSRLIPRAHHRDHASNRGPCPLAWRPSTAPPLEPECAGDAHPPIPLICLGFLFAPLEALPECVPQHVVCRRTIGSCPPNSSLHLRCGRRIDRRHGQHGRRSRDQGVPHSGRSGPATPADRGVHPRGLGLGSPQRGHDPAGPGSEDRFPPPLVRTESRRHRNLAARDQHHLGRSALHGGRLGGSGRAQEGRSGHRPG